MARLILALAAAILVGGLVYWGQLPGPASTSTDSAVSMSTETSAAVAPTPVTQPSTATSAGVSTASAVSTATTTLGAMVASPGSAAPLTPADFARKAEKVQAELPTTEKMRSLKEEEVEHRTPKTLLKAGAQIGDIADAVEKNPALAPEALAFYAKCARRSELATSARALCLANLRDLSKKQNAAADETGISPDVVKLADKLKEDK